MNEVKHTVYILHWLAWSQAYTEIIKIIKMVIEKVLKLYLLHWLAWSQAYTEIVKIIKMEIEKVLKLCAHKQAMAANAKAWLPNNLQWVF